MINFKILTQKYLITADNNIPHVNSFSLRKDEDEPKSVNLDKISTALHVYRLHFIAKSPNTVKSAQKQLRMHSLVGHHKWSHESGV